MKRVACLLTLLVVGMSARPTPAQGLLGGLLSNTAQTLTNTVDGVLGQPQGVIVRTNLGMTGLQGVCVSNGCTVVGSLDGNRGQLFLVQPAQGLIPNLLASVLRLVDGILDAEPDQLLTIPLSTGAGPYQTTIPSYLYQEAPVNYFGSVVWNGYVNQPASQIIRVVQAQSAFHVTGAGIVADVDTGVDPNHPALKPVLLQGYDFTRNQPGGSEMTDLGGATGKACSACQAAFVDQHTAAMLDQHTAAMLDGNAYAAFGHGTEVMGMIHLVAPTAHLLPLKAFSANGTGTLSNILSAIYYAVQHNANVINMSFELSSPSTELTDAINYAHSNNVVCAASAGNDGQNEVVYPAGLQQDVMGVASTNDFDQRSSFSNYGNQVVWIAAPGENVVTTYPFGTYSVTSGTSFTSPMVAGTAALLFNAQPLLNQSSAASAIANADWIGPNMGNGELDVYRALSSVHH
ncbi:MAG TPA: S8 family serine peptidase [Candidatus Acidoferrales bacterium]|nr:S8 family serine peptidase [Candidatus Acidoferrales bacterium]